MSNTKRIATKTRASKKPAPAVILPDVPPAEPHIGTRLRTIVDGFSALELESDEQADEVLESVLKCRDETVKNAAVENAMSSTEKVRGDLNRRLVRVRSLLLVTFEALADEDMSEVCGAASETVPLATEMIRDLIPAVDDAVIHAVVQP
ncbi:MAG: hypothetical protein JW751_08630 [Polyangiaceae bacterium]|nr:hypothetical protein [Polyangiaceae bacterium]